MASKKKPLRSYMQSRVGDAPKKVRAKKVPPPPRDDRDVVQKVRDGVYDNKEQFPSRTSFALGSKDPGFVEARRVYNGESQRLGEKFKQDLFAEHDVTKNPKAQRCFDIAWDERHSSSKIEVAEFFGEIVELIQ